MTHRAEDTALGLRMTAQQREPRSTDSVDVELVARAQKGDVGAFRELVERYQHRVLTLAESVIGNPHDAQEIVQEALLKAFRKLSSFKGESSFYTWLYRIVFNLAIDERRKRYRTAETLVGDTRTLDSGATGGGGGAPGQGNSSGVDPHIEFERSELRQQIKAGMASLSPDHRAVILLREVEGLSYDEISKVVGCSKGTVMSRLHHARKRLQRFLKVNAPQKFEHETEQTRGTKVGAGKP